MKGTCKLQLKLDESLDLIDLQDMPASAECCTTAVAAPYKNWKGSMYASVSWLQHAQHHSSCPNVLSGIAA